MSGQREEARCRVQHMPENEWLRKALADLAEEAAELRAENMALTEALEKYKTEAKEK